MENKEVSQESLDIIVMVARQMGPKYLFPGRSVDDMIQEGIYFGLRELKGWDGKRPLENWLRVVMRSRFLNYIRNNYKRYEKTTDPARAAKLAENNRSRQNIMSPVSVDDVQNSIILEDSSHEDVAYKELIEIIKDKMPVKLRGDFLKMIDGANIPTIRKEAVRTIVRSILEEYNG